MAASDWREWPPRLAHQPISDWVLTLEYAREIAREWNTADEFSGFASFVTRFAVDDAFIRQYPVQTVGGRASQSCRIRAADVGPLNRHIVGRIDVVEAHTGPGFVGAIDPGTNRSHRPCLKIGPSR